MINIKLSVLDHQEPNQNPNLGYFQIQATLKAYAKIDLALWMLNGFIRLEDFESKLLMYGVNLLVGK